MTDPDPLLGRIDRLVQQWRETAASMRMTSEKIGGDVMLLAAAANDESRADQLAALLAEARRTPPSADPFARVVQTEIIECETASDRLMDGPEKMAYEGRIGGLRWALLRFADQLLDESRSPDGGQRNSAVGDRPSDKTEEPVAKAGPGSGRAEARRPLSGGVKQADAEFVQVGDGSAAGSTPADSPSDAPGRATQPHEEALKQILRKMQGWMNDERGCDAVIDDVGPFIIDTARNTLAVPRVVDPPPLTWPDLCRYCGLTAQAHGPLHDHTFKANDR